MKPYHAKALTVARAPKVEKTSCGQKTNRQHSVMLFDPQTGEPYPYPSEATQYRVWHGLTAWLFNPWTGSRRMAGDVGSDVQGFLILPPEEPVYADQ